LTAILAVAIYGFGYFVPIRAYQWLAPVAGGGSASFQYVVWTASSCLMILLFTNRNRISDCLAGRLGETLGRFSFTIYLVQTLLICSVCSYTYQYLAGRLPLPVTLGATFGVYAVTLVLVSLVFVHFDELAIRLSRRFAGLMFGRVRRRTEDFPAGRQAGPGD